MVNAGVASADALGECGAVGMLGPEVEFHRTEYDFKDYSISLLGGGVSRSGETTSLGGEDAPSILCDLTIRPSQPLAVVSAFFHLMKIHPWQVTLAFASGG